MAIEDNQNTTTGGAMMGPKALRNLIIVMLVLLLGSAASLATFASMTRDGAMSAEDWATAEQRMTTADQDYGTLDPDQLLVQASLTQDESIEEFRARSENQVRDFYDSQEEGLYERIIAAGLFDKGASGEDPAEWNGMGGPLTDDVKLVQASLGGSADGSLSGLPAVTQPLSSEDLIGPSPIAPIGALPQVVFPGLSGPGGIIPPDQLIDPNGEVPIPAPLLLFPAGLALLAKRKKRRA